ncbi:MAG: WGR domain-containing protein [Planctomycetia bacterium]|nr:WGR domain-containing protein [Planctomycetia bacterium]
MTAFYDFLRERQETGGFSTEDVLATFLPLLREVLETHHLNMVAPLEGLSELRVEGVRAWFEEGKRQPPRSNAAELNRIEHSTVAALEIIDETRVTSELDDGQAKSANLAIGQRDQPVTRPVYLPGYVSWEHEVGHHDPLTDLFSLGMILASIACGLDFHEQEDLESFVAHRRNLFTIAPQLHPVLGRTITRMTEIDRHRRAQDLPALLKTLENYREQQIDFAAELARIQGFERADKRTRQHVVLDRLRERLFELSKRNRLLHFRSTLQSINLTHASVPLSFDPKNIDKIIAEARRDQAEFGFAQLRLVVCFLHWSNLKDKPIEQFDSPLVLLPVELKKKKGVRDTYVLEALSTEAEINPVVRHQLKQLYDLTLPETIDLAKTSLDEFFEALAAAIQAGDVAVTLTKIDRPRISLIHEKARHRLDHYRRRARLAGAGIRNFQDLDYSYDPANYHPLGVRLFSAKVRTPSTHLREIIEEKPRSRTYVSPEPEPVAEKERTFINIREGSEDNPYSWTFDLCSVTLANFKYRKMSLVRDYDALLADPPANAAFDATFSLAPRPTGRDLPDAPPLDERFDVVPCDPTQATAIQEAQAGKSYIIQGPPGTGKSQTITNLIADYIARGKRVLFVCEKRAAIDVVYARLRQCGLSELCCLIHDSQTDKKGFVMDLKQTYEHFLAEPALDKNGEKNGDARPEVLRRLKAELAPLEQFDAAMHQTAVQVGVPTRQLLDRCIELKDSRPELSPLEKERLPAYAAWHRHREPLERFAALLGEVQPDRVLARHPLRLLAPRLATADRPLELITAAVDEASRHLERSEQLLGQCGIPREQWETHERAKLLVDYARQVLALTRAGQIGLTDPKSDRAQQFAADVKELDNRRKLLGTAREATKGWRQKLPADELPTALEQAQAFNGQFFAWLKPAWWRLRGIMNRCYDFHSHVVRPTWVKVLNSLKSEYERLGEYESQQQMIVEKYHVDGEVETRVALVDRVRESIGHCPDWLRRIHAALLKSDQAEKIIVQVVAAADSVDSLAVALNRIADVWTLRTLNDLKSDLAGMKGALGQLPDYMQCLAELASVPSEVSAAIRTLPHTPVQVEAAVADRGLEGVYRQERNLTRFNGATRARHVQRMEKLYDAWLAANAREVRQRVRNRFRENIRLSSLPAAQLTADQKELKQRYNRGRRELEHEFGKTMRYKAIRDLISGESGEVVKDLKPVWLMSPLSVSDVLPLVDSAVDVVIFDEASQITLEEAVPAVFRAAQSIVVGDEMQLPPTDFFGSKRSEDEEGLQFEENGETVHYELESNSFLSHAAKNLPATMLGWHYRSRSESLISFSNWTFYDGRLLTVPEEELPNRTLPPLSAKSAADGQAGTSGLLERSVSFHFMEHGLYDKRRNRPEAEYIAEMVRTLLKQPKRVTIGIIAFSEAQQEEIEEALAGLAQEDSEFALLLDAEYEREEEGQFVGLLVKNLENIQGDERDVIILSVCYGRGPNGRMLMNFGPINQSGGEKRLNVSFSRAKHHMALVSSIRQTEITNDYNDGANCLKQYLRYAEAVSLGQSDVAERVLHGMSRWHRDEAAATPARDIVAEQLAAALTARGYHVDRDVGQSHFRCNLAVRRDGDTVYRLGILIDNAAYYEQADLLERDMMRPKLLRVFGWQVTHVLAKDWYDDRQEVLERVGRILEGKPELPPADDAHDPDADVGSGNGHSDGVTAAPKVAPVKPTLHLSLDDEPAAETPSAGLDIEEPAPAPAGKRSSTKRQTNGACSADGTTTASPRRFEYSDDHSHKFWEIHLADCEHTVRFGRIGTAGQTLSKTFENALAARRDVEQLIREKLAKGYREK